MMENTFQTKVRIPKGINISEPVTTVGPAMEKCTETNVIDGCQSFDCQTSWCYLFVHNNKVAAFAERLTTDGVRHFIHRSVVYQRKKQSRGIQAIQKPTISGLIFLQGTPQKLQGYLDMNCPNHYLVKNCSTRLPAVISNAVMLPFMRVLDTSPERIRFLLHPFKYYAGGNIKLRITSGFLAGIEGYVIRIDRDRRLVMDVGGMSVAISGVHCEKFEVVEEEHTKYLQQVPGPKEAPLRQLTDLQARIDRDLYKPHTQVEVTLIADVLQLWKERAAVYLAKWQVAEARDILFFLLEEIDYHCSSVLSLQTLDTAPILNVARSISMQIDAMITDGRYTEETREEIAAERDGCLSRFGYLFA